MTVNATDPPHYVRPQPLAPSGPNPVQCDRCGALVANWQVHSDWHAALGASDAVVVAALVNASGVKRSELTPEVRDAVDWASATAKANA